MRAILLTAALVFVPAAALADELPVAITPSDHVRVQTRHDPSRVPLPLRGQFVGSMVGMDRNTMTFVLEDGQPAVVHRDLIVGIETRVHQSRGKHALIGAGVGMALGALIGYASYHDSQDEWVVFTRRDTTVMGMIAFGAIGALIGTVSEVGEDWKEVPLDRVELNTASDAKQR
jgi:hypothetical protein